MKRIALGIIAAIVALVDVSDHELDPLRAAIVVGFVYYLL